MSENSKSRENEAASFLELSEFTFEYFTKDKSEAISILMLYSSVEISFKKAALAVIKQSVNSETRMQKAIIRTIIDDIQKESGGHTSKLAKAIQDELFRIIETTAKQKCKKHEKKDSKIISGDLDKLRNLRNQVAHATAININKTINEIDPTSQISIQDAYNAVSTFVDGALTFVKHDISAINEILEDFTAEAWAYSENPHDN